MHKIAIWGFGAPVINILPYLFKSNFEIEYVKVDYCRSNFNDFTHEIEKTGIKVYLNDYPNCELDAIFVTNYNRIIPEPVLSKYLVINYHVGLLPKWRGNSANGWAIINGENQVGYSIHRVTNMLDDGPLYYQFSYPYHEGTTYADAKCQMAKDLESKLPQILTNAICNPTNYIPYQSQEFVYCAKFRPMDGEIDWRKTTDEILRWFYVFGPPLGTGLKFTFKNKDYFVTKISRIDRFAISKGIPGSIVYITHGNVWIKTGDSAISIEELRNDKNEMVDISKTFIIGQRII